MNIEPSWPHRFSIGLTPLSHTVWLLQDNCDSNDIENCTFNNNSANQGSAAYLNNSVPKVSGTTVDGSSNLGAAFYRYNALAKAQQHACKHLSLLCIPQSCYTHRNQIGVFLHDSQLSKSHHIAQGSFQGSCCLQGSSIWRRPARNMFAWSSSLPAACLSM